MQTARTRPALDLDQIGRYAPEGVVAGFGAAALGAFVRLLSRSWREDPPCTLPDDDVTLALFSRTSPEEWASIKPAICLAFAPTDQLPDPKTGNRNRLVNAVARGIFDQLAAKAAEFSELQARKSRARWGDPPDPGGMPPGSRRVSDGSRRDSAPSVRSESPSLSLRRSSLTNESPRPIAQGEEREEICARLGEGARAIEEQRIREWKRACSLELLQNAIAAWNAAGLSGFPIARAGELADGPHSTPERIDSVLADIYGRIKSGGCKNPGGYLLCGLGLAEDRKGRVRPAPVSMFAEKTWREKEAAKRKTLEMVAAVESIRQRVQPQAGPKALGGGA